MNKSLVALATLAALLPGKSLAAEEENAFIAPPWYQVEVVIFRQDANYGGEQPPQEYQLSYPENWLYLTDPNADPGEEGNEALSHQLEQLSAALEEDIANLDTSANPGQSTGEIHPLQFEPAYVLLEDSLRNFNESATAINRRNKYQVLFHQAWRQPVSGEEDNWIIINGGKTFADRHALEGSLRLVKSRFLHFQANLWLTSFDPNRQLTPKPASENTLQFISQMDSEETSQSLVFLPLIPVKPPVDHENPETRINTQDENSPASEIMETAGIFQEEADEQEDQPTSYPISELWPVSQSKRIETEKEYYLDHPKLGILLRIDPYEPQLLNPPPEEPELTEQEPPVN